MSHVETDQSKLDSVFRDPKFFEVEGDDSVVEVAAISLECWMVVVDADGSERGVDALGFRHDEMFYKTTIDGVQETRYLNPRDRVRVRRNRISWARKR